MISMHLTAEEDVSSELTLQYFILPNQTQCYGKVATNLGISVYTKAYGMYDKLRKILIKLFDLFLGLPSWFVANDAVVLSRALHGQLWVTNGNDKT